VLSPPIAAEPPAARLPEPNPGVAMGSLFHRASPPRSPGALEQVDAFHHRGRSSERRRRTSRYRNQYRQGRSGGRRGRRRSRAAVGRRCQSTPLEMLSAPVDALNRPEARAAFLAVISDAAVDPVVRRRADEEHIEPSRRLVERCSAQTTSGLDPELPFDVVAGTAIHRGTGSRRFQRRDLRQRPTEPCGRRELSPGRRRPAGS